MQNKKNSVKASSENTKTKEEQIKVKLQEISDCKNNYVCSNDNTTAVIENIQCLLDEIENSIMNSQTDISKSVNNLEISSNERYELIKDIFRDLSVLISKDIENANYTIVKKLNEIKNSGSEQNTEIIKLLIATGTELKKIDKKITLMAEQSEKAIIEKVKNSEISVKKLFSEKISDLIMKMDSIEMKIQETKANVTSAIEDLNTSVSHDIMSCFEEINNTMLQINIDSISAHEELQQMIVELKGTEGEYQKELLKTLIELDSSFTGQNNENFNNIISTFQTLTQNMDTEFQAINQNVSQNFDSLNISVSESKDDIIYKLSENINEKHMSLSNITESQKAELLQRISQLENSTVSQINKLDGDIQSVFRRVSDGKKLVASALLTKNVIVSENATFQNIYDAILSIDQKIVIGAEQVPGTITYDYHYHTGNAQHGEGCYTRKMYHQHSLSCYTPATCQPTCLGLTHGSKSDNWIYHYDSRFLHGDCGQGISYANPRHRDGEACHCDVVSSHQYSKLTCEKDNSTFERWDVGCGFADGQIIGATIVYDQKEHSKLPFVKPEKQIQNYIPKVNEGDINIRQSEADQDDNEKETEHVIETEEISIEETEELPDRETETGLTENETDQDTESTIEESMTYADPENDENDSVELEIIKK